MIFLLCVDIYNRKINYLEISKKVVVSVSGHLPYNFFQGIEKIQNNHYEKRFDFIKRNNIEISLVYVTVSITLIVKIISVRNRVTGFSK